MSLGQSSQQIMKQYAELLEQVRNTRNIPALQSQVNRLEESVAAIVSQLANGGGLSGGNLDGGEFTDPAGGTTFDGGAF